MTLESKQALDIIIGGFTIQYVFSEPILHYLSLVLISTRAPGSP